MAGIAKSASDSTMDEKEVEVSTVPGSTRAVRRRDDEEAALASIDEMGHNEEVGATHVDRESSIFDMTVADSPDEDDVPRDISRRRRRARRRVQDSDGATNEEGSVSTHAVRRLVLVQSQQSTAVPAPTPIDAADNPGFEDTETVDGASVGGDEGSPEATPVGPPIVTG